MTRVLPEPPQAPSPPPVTSSGRRRWSVVAGIVVALGLVVAIATGSLGAQEDRSALPAAAVEPPDEWDARVRELVAFVESERGLEFEHPVQIDLVTPDEFSEELRASEGDLTHEDREEMETLVPTLRALGLVSGDLDVMDARMDLLDTSVAALYETDEERIVVPTEDPTAELSVAARVAIVHELVHALQDQHFDLDRDFDAESADPAALDEGFTALVEGDAIRIETSYTASLSGADLDEYTTAVGEQLGALDGGFDDVPSAMVAFISTPYVLGHPLVEIVALDGGNGAVDRAFDDPPSTGAQLLSPVIYLVPEPATELSPASLPEEVGEPIDDGQLGAVDIYLVLAERIDPFVALEAADGWGNAFYVTYEVDDRTCVRIRATGMSERGDEDLRAAFETWAAAAPADAAASVGADGDGNLLIESCDPGPDAELAHDRAMDVLLIPAIRSAVMWEMMQLGGMSAPTAWLAGDCVVREFTVEELSGAAPLPQEAIADAFAACRV